jgi:SAM-dependent methyltransferase
VDYYQADLALVHALGYGQHGDNCAPGILSLLAPVHGGLVLEVGCGAGALTRHLLAAGHRVMATDASPAMLELAGSALGVPRADLDLRRLVLPAADAIVSVGHVISYLPSAAAIDRALVALAGALRPGGVLAIDVCDLEFGRLRAGAANFGRVGPDFAVVTEFSAPSPEIFARDITTFVPDGAGAWRRGHEHHQNVLVDTSAIPALLARHGVTASVQESFGSESLPPGLRTVIGRRALCVLCLLFWVLLLF